MMTRNILNSLCGRAVAAVVLAGTVFLTGCANMVETAPPSGPAQSSGTMSGVVHGGQFPIYNAVVRLYSTGTGGYGSGSTLLATSANSDLGGNFSFTKDGTNGDTHSNTGSTWSCPATGNPQIYITAVGGNTQGTGTTASTSNNPASALIVGLGPCNSVTTGETLVINEITTVATVFALAQYINPGTTAGSLTIGTSSTTQGTTGINNAAANIANLAMINNGYPVNSNTYAGTNSAAGASITATPETAKIVTIANILASCINSANNVTLSASSTGSTPTASTACADIYNNATPPSPSVTSQPSATFAAPVDMIQAAYYMATNPSESNAAPTQCLNNSSAATKVICLYGLASSAPPFQTGLSVAPSDWTIGVTFTGSVGSGTCGGVTSSYLMAAPYHGAVDASGNLWFINGGSTTANIVELSPLGAPLVCVGNLSNGRGLTIDTAGNIWGSFNGVVAAAATMTTPATSGIQELTAASAASTTPTLTTWPVTTGQQTYSMTADGSGNVYFNVNGTGGTLWEFPGAAAASTPVSSVQIAGPFNGTSTTTLGYTQADPSGHIWIATSTIGDLLEVYSSTTASITAYAVAGTTVTFTAANSFSVGNTVTVSGLSTTEGATLNGTYTLTAATASTFAAATTASAITTTSDSGTATPAAGSYSFAKLATPNTSYGVAIDSNNYIYQGTTCCAGTGDREAVKWTPGSTVGTGTYTASTGLFAGINGVRAVTVDGASNVWLGSEYPNSSGATATTGNFSISEIATSGSGTTATFTSLSPPSAVTYAAGTCSTTVGCPTQGGYLKTSFGESLDMEVDPSGDLWVLNDLNADGTNGISVTEVIGAAVPVITPLSVAVKSSKLATKP